MVIALTIIGAILFVTSIVMSLISPSPPHFKAPEWYFYQCAVDATASIVFWALASITQSSYILCFIFLFTAVLDYIYARMLESKLSKTEKSDDQKEE